MSLVDAEVPYHICISRRIPLFLGTVCTIPCAGGLQGMRRNPYAPVVPCHRVIASNLCLGGFHGSWVRSCACVWISWGGPTAGDA